MPPSEIRRDEVSLFPDGTRVLSGLGSEGVTVHDVATGRKSYASRNLVTFIWHECRRMAASSSATPTARPGCSMP